MTAEAVNAASMAFKKALIERALGAELGHHLGQADEGTFPVMRWLNSALPTRTQRALFAVGVSALLPWLLIRGCRSLFRATPCTTACEGLLVHL